MGSCDF